MAKLILQAVGSVGEQIDGGMQLRQVAGVNNPAAGDSIGFLLHSLNGHCPS